MATRTIPASQLTGGEILVIPGYPQGVRAAYVHQPSPEAGRDQLVPTGIKCVHMHVYDLDDGRMLFGIVRATHEPVTVLDSQK